MTTTTGESPAAESPPTFDLLPLTPEVRRAIDELGWLTPTPVQLAAYAPASEGSDLVVQARTGTGKTAAFGLPLLELLSPARGPAQALILVPTRELAIQVSEELNSLRPKKPGGMGDANKSSVDIKAPVFSRKPFNTGDDSSRLRNVMSSSCKHE